MAVFTKLTENDIRSVLEEYDIGKLIRYEGIVEGIENTNYLLVTDKDSYILTIYEKRVDTVDLPFFMGLQHNLYDSGFACPSPIANKADKVINRISGKSYTIVSFLQGKGPKEITTTHIAAGAETLANLHNITSGSDYKQLHRENSLGRDFWLTTYAKIKNKAENEFQGLKQIIEQGFKKVENIPADLPKGIIHGDFFPDNVLFQDDRVSGVIDFYMACNDSYAYDLAIMLNSWCFEMDNSFNKTKTTALFRSYQSLRPLNKQEISSLPLLCTAASIRFLSSRLHDYFIRDENVIVKIKDPVEYIEKLKFHINIKSYTEYGL